MEWRPEDWDNPNEHLYEGQAPNNIEIMLQVEKTKAYEAGADAMFVARMKGVEAINESISEKEFMTMVIELCHLYGWRAAHFRTSLSQSGRYFTAVQGDAAGFPDLVLVRDGRAIVAELKSEKGKVTSIQKDWLDTLSTVAGIGVYVWKPSDWDKITELLK